MVLTPLIDIDNLNLSTFWTFVVIDDKGGEKHKDILDIWHRGREVKKERDQLKFWHTSRGSKLMNLDDAFECAFHMFACMA